MNFTSSKQQKKAKLRPAFFVYDKQVSLQSGRSSCAGWKKLLYRVGGTSLVVFWRSSFGYVPGGAPYLTFPAEPLFRKVNHIIALISVQSPWFAAFWSAICTHFLSNPEMSAIIFYIRNSRNEGPDLLRSFPYKAPDLRLFGLPFALIFLSNPEMSATIKWWAQLFSALEN